MTGRGGTLENSGVNSLGIKEFNRALVLKLICTHKDVSRIWLANETSLTRMTLSNIINGLIDNGFLCNVRDLATENMVGRRPVKVDLAKNSPVVAGICINREDITGILMDLKADVLCRVTYLLDENDTADTLTEKMMRAVDEITGSTKRRILGFGVSSIGPVNIEKGIILNPTNFYGITNIYAKQLIDEKTGLPVFVRNDMSAGALAEKYYGFGINIADFVYIGITDGVGAGIISGGELFQSRGGFAGEFGHMSIDFDGPKCSCGNFGCIEMYASGRNIVKTVNRECGVHLKTIEEVNEYSFRNEEAMKVLRTIMDRLAIAITGLVNIVDPSRVIIGGTGSALDMGLFKYMEEEVNKRILARGSKLITVYKAKFGEQANVIGSATIVADMIFSNRLKVLSV
jgi:predicted NBD/HSP70 family sugar kinase